MLTLPTSDASLLGQRAIVTGGGTGIGAAVARELASRGACVVIMGRSEEALERTASTLAGADVRHRTLDVTDPLGVIRAFDEIRERLGGIEILVNSAGIAESAPFERTEEALWSRHFEVNATGAYRCTRAALPSMRDAGYGRIVNVASVAGLRGYAYVCAYVASKHALIGLTRALATELASTGITVNAVCPGYADTPMTDRSVSRIVERTGRSAEDARDALARLNPLGRLIRPEEVAAAVGWLVLPSSSAVTGQAIVIAGGDVA